MTIDGRLARGERTRTALLDHAVALASQIGLDGLSLGQLADAMGVSKSGLFAHWRSKEDLQLATIDRAREQWAERVVGPALRAPRGIRRLWTLHERRMDFYRNAILPGRCFFASTQYEFDDRPGPVRDRLAGVLAEWMLLLTRLASEAVRAGELRADTDPGQLAFEIEAIGLTAVLQSRLLSADGAYAFARRGVLDRLRTLSTDPTRLPDS